jgi:hypothetical protein
MIDWFSVMGNALWILACALGLAILSISSWQASLQGVRLRAILGRTETTRVFYVAGLLFCVGLAIVSDSLLEIVLWAILGLLFCIALFFTRKQVENKGEKTSSQG